MASNMDLSYLIRMLGQGNNMQNQTQNSNNAQQMQGNSSNGNSAQQEQGNSANTNNMAQMLMPLLTKNSGPQAESLMKVFSSLQGNGKPPDMANLMQTMLKTTSQNDAKEEKTSKDVFEKKIVSEFDKYTKLD